MSQQAGWGNCAEIFSKLFFYSFSSIFYCKNYGFQNYSSRSVSPKIHVGDEQDSKFPWTCLKWHANFQLTFQNSNLGSSPFNKTKKGNKLKWWTTQILPRLSLYSRPSVESFHFRSKALLKYQSQWKRPISYFLTINTAIYSGTGKTVQFKMRTCGQIQ